MRTSIITVLALLSFLDANAQSIINHVIILYSDGTSNKVIEK